MIRVRPEQINTMVYGFALDHSINLPWPNPEVQLISAGNFCLLSSPPIKEVACAVHLKLQSCYCEGSLRGNLGIWNMSQMKFGIWNMSMKMGTYNTVVIWNLEYENMELPSWEYGRRESMKLGTWNKVIIKFELSGLYNEWPSPKAVLLWITLSGPSGTGGTWVYVESGHSRQSSEPEG